MIWAFLYDLQSTILRAEKQTFHLAGQLFAYLLKAEIFRCTLFDIQLLFHGQIQYLQQINDQWDRLRTLFPLKDYTQSKRVVFCN